MHNIINIFFLTFALTYLSLSATFIPIKNDDALKEALVDFDKAQDGDEDAVQKTLKKLKDIIKIKNTPQRESFYGSVTAMQAQHTILPWRKLKYAKAGFKLLDEALKKNPNNLSIRFNRIFAYAHTPSRLGKDTILASDVRYVMDLYKKKKIPTSIGYDFANKAFALFYNKQGDMQKRDKYFNLIKNKGIKNSIKFDR